MCNCCRCVSRVGELHRSTKIHFWEALGLVTCATAQAADKKPTKVYRYQDSGLTTYQDRAPSSVQDNGHAVLSKRGVVVKEVLSKEERRKARRIERDKELALIRDRALLATFTTEEDLTRTRDDRVGMIDGLISRLDDRIRILSERLSIVEKRILQQEQVNGTDGAQKSLYAEQHSIQRNIENAWSLIDSKAAERNVVATKFESDLIRYRELKVELGQTY